MINTLINYLHDGYHEVKDNINESTKLISLINANLSSFKSLYRGKLEEADIKYEVGQIIDMGNISSWAYMAEGTNYYADSENEDYVGVIFEVNNVEGFNVWEYIEENDIDIDGYFDTAEVLVANLKVRITNIDDMRAYNDESASNTILITCEKI